MNGRYRALRLEADGSLAVLDQRVLPFIEEWVKIEDADSCAQAISDMTVRGAGVIGDVAAFGVYLASRECDGDIGYIERKAEKIRSSRPTAVNLMWAVDRMMDVAGSCERSERTERLKAEAVAICDEDAECSRKIGEHGADLIEELIKSRGLERVNLLTHCNAGWLAIVDEGSALAPVYEAAKRGIDIHVWVDETRPRNQGANLTAWELGKSGIPHTVIADNAGGHLMQHGMVDLCITGADRVSRNGDAANKIGTYLKALAAKDNSVPFYIALPSSTFDFSITDGIKEIPIEVRSEEEVTYIRGVDEEGRYRSVRIVPENSAALNYGFDVTPARLITGLITERGVCRPETAEIENMFKDLL
ncbi:methylthioribose-1-phosphate isomerase [Hydrogenimonas sp.]|nr:methylthioribose-1-phosphate isomerase [Hydrogenimonas sp.]